MAKPTYLLDGVDLNDSAHRWYLEQSTKRRGIPGTRRATLTVPGRHGEQLLPGETYTPGTVAWSIIVTDRDATGQPAGAEQAEQNLDRITWLLTQAGRERTCVHRIGTLERHARVGAIAATQPEALDGRLTRYQINAVATTLDPFWTDGDGPVDTTPAAITNGAQITLTALAGGTAPIDDAIIRVLGPANPGLQLTDPAGTALEFEAAIAAGQYLFVDLATYTARLSATATHWTTGGTDATGSLDYPAAGQLELTPTATAGSTTTGYRLTATGAGFTAATALTVRAERKYL